MTARIITDDDAKEIALVFLKSNRSSEKDKIDFVSKEHHFLQVGLWNEYGPSHKILTHKHNPTNKIATMTQELFYVESGKIMVYIYDDYNYPIDKVELGPGDILVQLAGGHGFDILEKGTVVLEVKNGPFTGTVADKTRMELPKWK